MVFGSSHHKKSCQVGKNKDKSVISSSPTYFENKESPIICYKYNKLIRSTVFNYNKLVTELDIENSIPDS